MYGAEPEDVFYYLTLYNENYPQPPRPDRVAEGIVQGLYRWEAAEGDHESVPAIIFSGTANLAAREAAAELAEHYGIACDLWSATSYKHLREEALAVDRWNLLHPGEEPRVPWVTKTLAEVSGPVVAVTDYMKMVPDQVARWVPQRFVTLGTDGFGRSDSRTALRRFFEIDTGSVVVATLSALASEGQIRQEAVTDALERYDIDPDRADPAHDHR
jgi:pyruvate dehydrogenase E1 component